MPKTFPGHATGAEDVQELHSLHLKAIVAIYHEQNYIYHLC